MKATIECKKCKCLGSLTKVFKFSEYPRSVVALYLPKNWRAISEEPYCKVCSANILKEFKNLL